MNSLPAHRMTSQLPPVRSPDRDVVYHPDVIATRVVVIGSLLMVAVLAVVWTTGLTSALRTTDCRSWPTLLAFGQETEASMIVHGAVACPISLQVPSLRVDELKMTTMPENGTLAARGRTGVTYRPSPNFKGEDFFAFAVRGRVAAHEGTTAVRVRVAVQ